MGLTRRPGWATASRKHHTSAVVGRTRMSCDMSLTALKAEKDKRRVAPAARGAEGGLPGPVSSRPHPLPCPAAASPRHAQRATPSWPQRLPEADGSGFPWGSPMRGAGRHGLFWVPSFLGIRNPGHVQRPQVGGVFPSSSTFLSEVYCFRG